MLTNHEAYASHERISDIAHILRANHGNGRFGWTRAAPFFPPSTRDRKRPAGIPQIAVPIHRRTSPLEIPMDCIPACSQPSSPCTLPRPSPTHGAAKHKAPAQPSPCRGFTKRASSFMLFPFRDGRFRCVRLNAPAERRSVNRFPGARYSCSASARCRRESACR